MILKKSLKILVPLLCLFLVAEIFYLSWMPEGHLGLETYLPVWLLDWSEIHFNLRTAIPFIALGFLFEIPESLFVKTNGYKTNFYPISTH